MPKTLTKKRGRAGGASIRIASVREALAKASGVPKVSRPQLAKLVGAHVNTVALWEAGKPIGPKYVQQLKALQEKISRGERVSLPAAGRPGRPRGPGRPKKPGRPRGAGRRSSAVRGAFDVKALRTRLGASRDAFAKMLGVSPGSVFNWENGKPITARNLAAVKALAGGAPSAPVAAAPSAPLVRRGRPGRPVSIKGEGPLICATVVQVSREGGQALLRFGARVPGGGVRAVAEVVLPVEALDALGR